MIAYPRALLIAMGTGFSIYHVVLALFSFRTQAVTAGVVVALVLYALATLASLWPKSPTRMPLPLASANLAVAVLLPLLVTPALDPDAANGYATWYVAAVGTLLTVTCARRQPRFAWAGMIFLTVHTFFWAGPEALATLGVLGGFAWVGIAQLLTRETGRASEEARVLEAAERAAASWRAAEEAHLSEREVRLEQTRAIASDMLRRIVAKGSDLTEEERRECRLLEASVRDEIRGRRLLDDDVRRRVLAARRRGVTVSVLDDGGLDQLPLDEIDRVLQELADALDGIRPEVDRIVVRTGSSDSDSAVTVVGLRTSGDGSARALGHDDGADEVDAWVEIRRRVEKHGG